MITLLLLIPLVSSLYLGAVCAAAHNKARWTGDAASVFLAISGAGFFCAAITLKIMIFGL